jgi:hypothetical protein
VDALLFFQHPQRTCIASLSLAASRTQPRDGSAASSSSAAASSPRGEAEAPSSSSSSSAAAAGRGEGGSEARREEAEGGAMALGAVVRSSVSRCVRLPSRPAMKKARRKSGEKAYIANPKCTGRAPAGTTKERPNSPGEHCLLSDYTVARTLQQPPCRTSISCKRAVRAPPVYLGGEDGEAGN